VPIDKHRQQGFKFSCETFSLKADDCLFSLTKF